MDWPGLGQLDAERFDGYLVLDWPSDVPEFQDTLAKARGFVTRTMGEVRRGNLLRRVRGRWGRRRG